MLKQPVAMLLGEMDDDLAVTVGAEYVALGLKLLHAFRENRIVSLLQITTTLRSSLKIGCRSIAQTDNAERRWARPMPGADGEAGIVGFPVNSASAIRRSMA